MWYDVVSPAFPLFCFPVRLLLEAVKLPFHSPRLELFSLIYCSIYDDRTSMDTKDHDIDLEVNDIAPCLLEIVTLTRKSVELFLPLLKLGDPDIHRNNC